MRPNEIGKNIQVSPTRLVQNGAWGFGMSSALFPPNMNGPLGSMFRPLPNNDEFPNVPNGPEYNAKTFNGPSYNQKSFEAISGTNGTEGNMGNLGGISGYSFNKFGTNVSGSNDNQIILFIEPSIG